MVSWNSTDSEKLTKVHARMYLALIMAFLVIIGIFCILLSKSSNYFKRIVRQMQVSNFIALLNVGMMFLFTEWKEMMNVRWISPQYFDNLFFYTSTVRLLLPSGMIIYLIRQYISPTLPKYSSKWFGRAFDVVCWIIPLYLMYVFQYNCDRKNTVTINELTQTHIYVENECDPSMFFLFYKTQAYIARVSVLMLLVLLIISGRDAMLREGPAIILDPATKTDLLKMTVQTFLFSICSIAQTDIFFFFDSDRKSNMDSQIPFMHSHLYIIMGCLCWDPIIILVSRSSYCKHKISKFLDLFRGTNEDFEDPAYSIEMSTIA